MYNFVRSHCLVFIQIYHWSMILDADFEMSKANLESK